MDPISLGLMLGGTILSGAGGLFGKSEAYKNAQAMAAAANASVAKNVGKLNEFEGQDQGIFGGLMDKYDPALQEAQLQNAQKNRADTNVANISTPDPSGVPLPSGSPASGADLAKRLASAHDFAVNRAKSMGKLGGYGDAWLTNQINNTQANDQIGVVNNQAEARKGLVQPEAELASQGAYKTPSIWGPLMQGVGSIMSAAGGQMAGGGGGWSNLFAGKPSMVTGLNYDEAGNAIATPMFG